MAAGEAEPSSLNVGARRLQVAKGVGLASPPTSTAPHVLPTRPQLFVVSVYPLTPTLTLLPTPTPTLTLTLTLTLTFPLNPLLALALTCVADPPAVVRGGEDGDQPAVMLHSHARHRLWYLMRSDDHSQPIDLTELARDVGTKCNAD